MQYKKEEIINILKMVTNNKEKILNKCAKSFFPNKFVNIKK